MKAINFNFLTYKTLVNLLCLYGIYKELGELKEDITLPKALKDEFIDFASSNLAPIILKKI